MSTEKHVLNYRAVQFEDAFNVTFVNPKSKEIPPISHVGHFCGDATSLFVQLSSLHINFLIDLADGGIGALALCGWSGSSVIQTDSICRGDDVIAAASSPRTHHTHSGAEG